MRNPVPERARTIPRAESVGLAPETDVRRAIMVPVLGAFLLALLANERRHSPFGPLPYPFNLLEHRNPLAHIRDLGPRFLIGGGVVFVVLMMASDVPALTNLALTFAWLLFISSFVVNGKDAFDWLMVSIPKAKKVGTT